jgi:DNA-binding response OmpR family regulator
MLAKIFRGTVLLVTNNEGLRDCLQRALLQAGYGIRVVRSQEEGLRVLRDINPAILVVDRRESGFSRLHHEMTRHSPIVTVMYHSEACHEEHCVIDIEDGAARAVCNASPGMIVALLGAVLRRQRWEQTVPERYVTEGMTIDFQKYVVTVGGTPVHTSATEFRILKSLVATPGHFVSRTALLDHVWGEGFAVGSHTLDVHISSLRRKLNHNGTSPALILTVKGLGYKLRSMTLPAAGPLLKPYRSMIHAIRHSSALGCQTPNRSVNVPGVGGSQWRHKPDRHISARYRIKPLSDRGQG